MIGLAASTPPPTVWMANCVTVPSTGLTRRWRLLRLTALVSSSLRNRASLSALARSARMRARLGGGLPRIATSHRDLRLRLAGGGEGGIAIARGDETLAAHLDHAQFRDIAFLQQLLVRRDLLVEQGQGFAQLGGLDLRLGAGEIGRAHV